MSLKGCPHCVALIVLGYSWGPSVLLKWLQYTVAPNPGPYIRPDGLADRGNFERRHMNTLHRFVATKSALSYKPHIRHGHPVTSH